MSSKKQIVALAEKHGITVEFEFYTCQGSLDGETRLTMPEGQTVVGGASGYTIQADPSEGYSRHLTEVMRDLKDMIGQLI
jgi:hypothetical protein